MSTAYLSFSVNITILCIKNITLKYKCKTRILFFCVVLAGMLSSSEDEGDSYSSDGEDGLVIDANAHQSDAVAVVVNQQNGHQDTTTCREAIN